MIHADSANARAMIRSPFVTLLILLVAVGSVTAQEPKNLPDQSDESEETDQPRKRDTREASVDADDMLVRFLDELVVIRPGHGDFPESLHIGDRQLRVVDSFRISRYETTQELFQAVMKANPSRWKGPRNSVENVTRRDADEFCHGLTNMLRDRELITAPQIVRLPTAEEWEYCCRARSAGRYCFSDDTSQADEYRVLSEYSWHTGNAAGNDPAVGVLRPNRWGLFDMHGYLWEYVDDAGPAAESDPRKPVIATWAMGGSWRDPAEWHTSDSRLSVPVYATSDAIGFRCVLTHAAEPVE